MSRKYRVGILGATGTVGQRFIQLLEGHPQFEVTALAASDRSQGKAYSEACAWRLPGEMPGAVRALKVEAPRPPLDCELVFSSLPGEIARETEEAFASAGYAVMLVDLYSRKVVGWSMGNHASTQDRWCRYLLRPHRSFEYAT